MNNNIRFVRAVRPAGAFNLAALAVALALASQAQATIISGESASASTELSSFSREAVHAVDDSGLSVGDNSALTAEDAAAMISEAFAL